MSTTYRTLKLTTFKTFIRVSTEIRQCLGAQQWLFQSLAAPGRNNLLHVLSEWFG